jgi:hypothetical protein
VLGEGTEAREVVGYLAVIIRRKLLLKDGYDVTAQ